MHLFRFYLLNCKVEVLFEKLTAALKVQMKFHLKRLGVSPVGPQSW